MRLRQRTTLLESPEIEAPVAGVKGGPEYVYESVRVRNISEQPLVSVTFLVVVGFFPFDRPVVFIESEPVPVSLAPGEAVGLDIHLLCVRHALELQRDGKAQTHLAVTSTRDASGMPSTWTAPRSSPGLWSSPPHLPRARPRPVSTIGDTSIHRGPTSRSSARIALRNAPRGVWLDIGTLGADQGGEMAPDAKPLGDR
jgi:hypothetical protein